MKSTPRLAILSEASQLNLEYRRRIATQFLPKIIIIQNHPLIFILFNIRRRLIINPEFYNDKNVPYLVLALESFFPYYGKIYKTANLPCYEINFDTLINPLETLIVISIKMKV